MHAGVAMVKIWKASVFQGVILTTHVMMGGGQGGPHITAVIIRPNGTLFQLRLDDPDISVEFPLGISQTE